MLNQLKTKTPFASNTLRITVIEIALGAKNIELGNRLFS